MKPVIGITSNFKTINDRLNCAIDYDYISAVNKAGGIGLILPIITDEGILDDYSQILDGLVFSGGEDIETSYYGENPIEQIGTICLDRDICEMGLFKRAYEKNIPVLGICRGMQLINVALGGSLYQDIKTQIDVTLEHRSKKELVGQPHHSVKVMKDSMLYKMLGVREADVNSFHHQSLKDIGRGLKVTAITPKGIIEGIESEEKEFLIGVQWHPEKLIGEYPLFNGIFDTFIEACLKFTQSI